MIDFELVVDEMIIAARAAILDGEVLELEPSQFSDCMIHVMEKLRQAEKDAARYRWLRDDADEFDTNDFFMCSQVSEKRDAFADEAMNGSNN